MSNKEKRGIYNVTLNEKNATAIKTDIELIEEAIITELTYYVKGFHDKRRKSGLGAEHIKLHLEKGSEGEIHMEELVNLGNSIREYLKIFNEPFIDKDGRKIYEWQNDKGVRFRVVNDFMSEKTIQTLYQRGGLQLPLSPSDNAIVTFYSDRNINKAMEFKNPKVKEYYAKNEIRNDEGTNVAFHANNNISSNTEGIIPNNSIFSNFKAKSKEIKNHTQRIDQKINKNKTPIQKNNQQTLENQSSQIKTKRKNQ